MPRTKQSHGLFITGTDTGVGKTYVGSRLARRLTALGVTVTPRKPVESGCERHAGLLEPADARSYWHAVAARVPLDEICRYRLATPASPERAAALEGMDLSLTALVAAATEGAEGWRLVEGAGGFYSPIANGALNADLAVALELPVLLVVGDRLGCINHALLTLEAIARRGLLVSAVVLNPLDEAACAVLDNAQALSQRLTCPLVRSRFDAADPASSWIDELIGYLPIGKTR
ncbi:MAG: dethiobiotin synthase [Thiotrichales bacterium]